VDERLEDIPKDTRKRFARFGTNQRPKQSSYRTIVGVLYYQTRDEYPSSHVTQLALSIAECAQCFLRADPNMNSRCVVVLRLQRNAFNGLAEAIDHCGRKEDVID
jgi:hypothetical protein